VPDDDLTLIDSVTSNRSEFMTSAARRAAIEERRRRDDDEIARICADNSGEDAAIAREFASTMSDGLAGEE